MTPDDAATNNVTFCPASKLSFDPRPQLAALFVDGFYNDLKHFSKDKAKLAAAFTPAFLLDTFFVALGPNNNVLAMVGCPDLNPALELNRDEFTTQLGPWRGRLAYHLLMKFLIDHSYPFEVKPGTGSIEYVVADPAIRGKGITGRLIEYVMHQRGYAKYVLEVASTNTRAVKLYQRLGFKEFMRKPAPKQSGVGDYAYMSR